MKKRWVTFSVIGQFDGKRKRVAVECTSDEEEVCVLWDAIMVQSFLKVRVRSCSKPKNIDKWLIGGGEYFKYFYL